MNHIIRGKVSDMNAMINESINGMTIIQAFRREKQMEEEFSELNDEHYRYQNKLLKVEAATSHNLSRHYSFYDVCTVHLVFRRRIAVS